MIPRIGHVRSFEAQASFRQNDTPGKFIRISARKTDDN